MDEESFESWLRSRVPPVPEPFLSHLTEATGGREERLEPAGLGLEALSRALERPGRNREAAFHLLAADALLTYACEEASRDSDARRGLQVLMGRIGDSFL